MDDQQVVSVVLGMRLEYNEDFLYELFGDNEDARRKRISEELNLFGSRLSFIKERMRSQVTNNKGEMDFEESLAMQSVVQCSRYCV